jgi:predicted subunit of tRNA(5-methylaminomethyl-2-thiouridylate) methyltransferase
VEVFRQLADQTLTDVQVEALVSEATREMDDHPDEPFWQLVDYVAELRGIGERELTLVSQILEVVARHAQRAHRRA